MSVKGGKYYTMSLRLLRRWDEVYGKLYRTKSHGMHEAINSFPVMRTQTIREMQGVFSNSELRAMLKHFRHTVPEEPMLRANKENFINLLIDSASWNNLEAKYNISYDDLVWKVNKLTSVQVYFLQSEIVRHWKMKHLGYTIQDFFNIFNP